MRPPVDGAISAREQEVINLVAQGLTNVQVGERLNLQPNTVKSHLQRIYRKTGATGRAEMVSITRGAVVYKTSAQVVELITWKRMDIAKPVYAKSSASWWRQRGQLFVLDQLIAEISAMEPDRRPGLPMSQDEHERQARLREMSR